MGLIRLTQTQILEASRQLTANGLPRGVLYHYGFLVLPTVRGLGTTSSTLPVHSPCDQGPAPQAAWTRLIMSSLLRECRRQQRLGSGLSPDSSTNQVRKSVAPVVHQRHVQAQQGCRGADH